MSHVIATYEPTKPMMFDWHHEDIINNPPYDHFDMVVALADGNFIIEGKVSNIEDAQFYADYHNGEPDVWKALEAIDNDQELILEGKIF